VSCVCDERSERLKESASRFHGIFVTSQLDRALRHDAVDAVIVCTNATTHYSVTRHALQAGKHVLVEKPLTTASADAERLIELAASQSVVLMVGQRFVYNASIREMKEYIDAGRDQVYYLYSSRTNLGPIRTDVNALWDPVPRDVSTFNYLLDRTPHWVSAVRLKVIRNGREDVGFISLGYGGGWTDIMGHIHVSWSDPHKAQELVVVGSDRRIVFNDLNGVEKVRVFDKGIPPTPAELATYGEFRLQFRNGGIASRNRDVSEPLKKQCRHFVECVTAGAVPITSARDAAQVVGVLEAIDRSLMPRGAPVEVKGGWQ
jgi:predicted dehydrogenase